MTALEKHYVFYEIYLQWKILRSFHGPRNKPKFICVILKYRLRYWPMVIKFRYLFLSVRLKTCTSSIEKFKGSKIFTTHEYCKTIPISPFTAVLKVYYVKLNIFTVLWSEKAFSSLLSIRTSEILTGLKNIQKKRIAEHTKRAYKIF